MQKKIDILFFDAASGHRSAAKALQRAIFLQQPNWEVNTINVVDLFQHHTVFQKIVIAGINYFNFLLQREILSDLPGLIRLSLFVQSTVGKKGQKNIAQFWKNTPPDAVISVTPMYNEVCFKSLKIVNPDAQYITIPVDFAEPRKRYWFTPKINVYYLNAKNLLMDQAHKAGIDKQNMYKIGGMVVDPDFYLGDIDQKKELEKKNLNPELPTITVSFGGQSSVILKIIATQLNRLQEPINVIFLCGKNETVFNYLSQQTYQFNKLVLGYQKETPVHFFKISDIVIGKPGAMTITECLIAKKPSLFIKSTGLDFVQRGNENWVEEHKVGIIVRDLKELPSLISDMLTNKVYRENAENNFHRGVFDAAEKIIALSS